jgi:hypothetical protein
MIELNRVRARGYIVWPGLRIQSQKFRLYLLDSDKAMDIVAYLLCYGLDIKDKPRKRLFSFLIVGSRR